MEIADPWLERERFKLKHGSLLPPRHDPPPDAQSCLLDTEAYLANRKNKTTASCPARGGTLVQGPRVSYLCVCCPGKSPYEQFACEPNVVATEADLVLIRMAFGPHHNSNNPRKCDFFIYRAAGQGRPPSLTRILPPKPFVFPANCHVALLPRYEEDPHLYYIVILRKRKVPPTQEKEEEDIEFDIHIYSSKTATWSCKPTSLVVNKQHDRSHLDSFCSEKVITIGGEGGAVAWVDLWRGFLQCDVLKDTSVPMLHYVQLPPHLVPAYKPHTDSYIERDVAFIGGRIKFVHLRNKVCPRNPYIYMVEGWTAATYSRAAMDPCEVGWQQDGNAIEVDAKCLSAEPMLLQHLPKLLHGSSGVPKPSSERICRLTCPVLSLCQDDLLYVMAKVTDWDGNALGLALDLTKGTLEKVVHVNAARTLWGILFSITQCRISKYLDMDPGSRFVLHKHTYF
ncbi:unnamed protein product [Urochloa humidicola]